MTNILRREQQAQSRTSTNTNAMNFPVVGMQGWVSEIYWSLYDVLDAVNGEEAFSIRYAVLCDFFVLI